MMPAWRLWSGRGVPMRLLLEQSGSGERGGGWEGGSTAWGVGRYSKFTLERLFLVWGKSWWLASPGQASFSHWDVG